MDVEGGGGMDAEPNPMASYSDQNREEYLRDGLTVLRGAIPPSLLTDLRHEAETARTLARERFGPQAQRLQPVFDYPEIDPRPFEAFHQLPAMQSAVDDILGHEHGQSRIMGILLEPAAEPWCTHWHRDWGYNVPDLDMDAFFAACANLKMFNQLNGALYDDHSLWVIPCSHNRLDTQEEVGAFDGVPPRSVDLSGATTAEEREVACQQYVRAMPGAVNVPLMAGDVAFYRACAWHLGNYVPYVRRATLHDGYYGPDDKAWREAVPGMQARMRAARQPAD